MIYGFIFLEHIKLKMQDQRDGILQFARKRNISIDKFISVKGNPNMRMFNFVDTIICYAWNCLCKEMFFMRTFIRYVIENKINIYSVTIKYYTDSKNKTHIMDGKVVQNIYNDGFIAYAISKKSNVYAPTIKRFLTTTELKVKA